MVGFDFVYFDGLSKVIFYVFYRIFFFLLLFGEEMNFLYDVVFDSFESMVKDVKVYIWEFFVNMRVFDKIVKENIEWY